MTTTIGAVGKEAILEFMRLMLYQLHPDFDSYPIKEMDEIGHKDGHYVGFQGTRFEAEESLIQAYRLHNCIKALDSDW